MDARVYKKIREIQCFAESLGLTIHSNEESIALSFGEGPATFFYDTESMHDYLAGYLHGLERARKEARDE